MRKLIIFVFALGLFFGGVAIFISGKSTPSYSETARQFSTLESERESSVNLLRTNSKQQIVPKHILLISGRQLTHKWSFELTNRVTKYLKEKYPDCVVSFLELNTASASDTDCEARFKTFLPDIKAGKFDMILSILDASAELLTKYAKDIPAKTPVIICGNCGVENLRAVHPNSHGVHQYINLNDTIRLGLTLVPAAKSILIITDSHFSGKIFKAQAEKFKRDNPELDVRLIDDKNFTTQQMIAEVKKMPRDSFIVFTPWRNFARDGYATIATVGREIFKNSKAPYLVVTDVLVGEGAIGGKLSSGSTNGLATIKSMENIFEIGTAENLKDNILNGDTVLDMSVLRNLGIELPKIKFDTPMLLNKTPSFWERYENLTIPISYFLCAFCIFIATALLLYWRYKNFKKRVSTILGYLPMRLFVFDKHGKVLFKQAKEYERTRIDGGNIKSLGDIPFDDKNAMKALVEKSFESQSETKYLYSDVGTTRMARLNKMPKNLFGRESVVFYSDDVSQLVEERLNREKIERQNSAIFNTIDDCIITTDTSAKITLMNVTAQVFTGYSQAEAQEKNIDEILKSAHSDGDEESISAKIEKNLSENIGPQAAFDFSVLDKNNKPHNIKCFLKPIIDDGGNPVGNVVVFCEKSPHDEIANSSDIVVKCESTIAKLAKITYFKLDKNMKLLMSATGGDIWAKDKDGKPIPIDEWVSPQCRALFHESMTAVKTGIVPEISFEYTSEYSGNLRAFRMRVIARKNEDGEQEFIGVIQENTDFRKSENTQKRANFLLDTLLNSFPCSVFGKDYSKDGAYILSNVANSRLLQRNPSDIIGLTDYDLFPQECAEEYRANDYLALNAKTPLEFTETILLPNGTRRFVHSHKTAMTDSNGHSIVFGVSFDVTELTVTRQLMSTHTEHEELLKDIFEEIICDDGNASNFNNILEKTARYMKADAACILKISANKTSFESIAKWGAKNTQCNACMEYKIRPEECGSNKLPIFETTIKVDGDPDKTVSIAGISVMVGGKLWGVMRVCFPRLHILNESERVILGEISNVIKIAAERIDNINRMRSAITEARNAAKAKSTFLATMSHEIRTPLNSVIGYSELAESQKDFENSQTREAIKNINFSAKSLLSLINDILDISKLEAEQMDILPSAVNMENFLNDTLRIFNLTAQRKGIATSTEIQSDMPTLMLDVRRIRQVLVNLLGNAIKFTDRGFVKLSASYIDGTLTIAIEDSGIGISQNFIESIFKPFTQDKHSCSHIYEGTGLGLAISDKLIRVMGGNIAVESKLGEGSKFTVTLPNIMVASKEHMLATSAAQSANFDFSIKNKLIFVIDDVEMNAKILCAMIERLGGKCASFSSAREAITALSETRPDIILTDLWMPEINGIQLAKNLKSSPETASIPIVAVTADSQFNDSDFFDDVLLKPLSFDSLSATLEKLSKERLG